MKSTVVIKSDLNKLLKSAIGERYIDNWWQTSIVSFDGKTPNELYWAGGEQRQRVIDYVVAQYFGDYTINSWN